MTGFVVVEAGAFRADLEKLERSHRGIRDDVAKLVRRLESDPTLPGDVIPGVGGETRKIRLAVRSMRRGSQGGARVIAQVYRDVQTVVLLLLYVKSEREDVSREQIERARRDVGDEIIAELVRRGVPEAIVETARKKFGADP